MIVVVEHPLGIRAEMDVDDLIGPLGGGYENDNEIAQWSGYLCKCHGLMVQRSAAVTLKRMPEMATAEVGSIG